MEVSDTLLGDFLLDSGLVTRGQLEETLRFAQGKSLSSALLETGIISEDELRRATAHTLGIPFVVLERHEISSDALIVIPEPLSRIHNMIAYRVSEDGIEVALLDIADLAALDFLKGKIKIKVRLTTRDTIKRALLLYQKHLKEKFAGMIQASGHAVDSLIRHALASSATHIHIDPMLTGHLVRYRIAGFLHEAMQLPQESGVFIVEQLKQLAKLFPITTSVQEGRFKLDHHGELVSVGVSTVPTAHGEKLLVRLARPSHGQQGFTLSSLGVHGDTLERIHTALRERGFIVVVGSQGSGKTTFLYTLLDLLNEPGVSITTIEAQVSHRLPHVAQMQSRPDMGLSMTAGLRAILHSDPDVVMIDEVESSECAQLASSAARRGMLVLAATKDASDFAAADTSVSLKLVPRLCDKCKEKYQLSRQESDALENPPAGGANFAKVLAALRDEEIVDKQLPWKDLQFYTARGCRECTRGYKGVLGLQEISDSSGAGLNLIEDGLFKAAQGLTSIEAILNLS